MYINLLYFQYIKKIDFSMDNYFKLQGYDSVY